MYHSWTLSTNARSPQRDSRAKTPHYSPWALTAVQSRPSLVPPRACRSTASTDRPTSTKLDAHRATRSTSHEELQEGFGESTLPSRRGLPVKNAHAVLLQQLSGRSKDKDGAQPASSTAKPGRSTGGSPEKSSNSPAPSPSSSQSSLVNAGGGSASSSYGSTGNSGSIGKERGSGGFLNFGGGGSGSGSQRASAQAATSQQQAYGSSASTPPIVVVSSENVRPLLLLTRMQGKVN